MSDSYTLGVAVLLACIAGMAIPPGLILMDWLEQKLRSRGGGVMDALTADLEVHECSACGEDHHSLLFFPLTWKKVIRGVVMTHSALCPRSNSTANRVYMCFTDGVIYKVVDNVDEVE